MRIREDSLTADPLKRLQFLRSLTCHHSGFHSSVIDCHLSTLSKPECVLEKAQGQKTPLPVYGRIFRLRSMRSQKRVSVSSTLIFLVEYTVRIAPIVQLLIAVCSNTDFINCFDPRITSFDARAINKYFSTLVRSEQVITHLCVSCRDV